GRKFGIALSDQGVKVWEHGSGYQKRIVLVEEWGFISSFGAEGADHEFGGVFGPWIGKGVLPGREAVVGAGARSEKSWDEHRRAQRIHEAEADRLEEGAGVVEGADGSADQVPFVRTRLLELRFGH